MKAGTCRFCSCIETRPCDGGCAWTDDTRTLCTACLAAATIAMELVRILGIVSATPKADVHLTKAGSWDGITLEQQRGLVLACRTYLAGVNQVLETELGEQARDNAEELDVIASFMLDKCPDELTREGEPLSAIVVRLLTPHVGKRVVLASSL
jgi:hypothetical protein